MKTLATAVLMSLTFVACNDAETDSTTYMDSSSTTTSPAAMATQTTPGARTPSDGDVTYNSGRVQVYRDNSWNDADDDVRFDNGVVVYRDGRATRDGVEVELEDGYVVDRDGNVWDRTGNAISDAWDATKHGVKKAGKAVGNAAEKAGDKVKDAVD